MGRSGDKTKTIARRFRNLPFPNGSVYIDICGMNVVRYLY